MIVLKNETGKRRGNYIRYEYGNDLFGYMYLDIIRSRKHRAKFINRHIFTDPKDFILTLDVDMERRDALDYLPVYSKDAFPE